MEPHIEISLGSVSPFPATPEPTAAEPQPPMVYVSEAARWEYKVVNRARDAELLGEDELNRWGDDGWELAGIVVLAESVRVFFKRPVT